MSRFISISIVFALLSVLSLKVSGNDESADIAYLAYTKGYWQVWVMDQHGKQKKQVTRSSYDKARLSWYPDGKSILINGSQGTVASVDIDTGEEKIISLPLKGMTDAVISGEGKRIAFSLSTSESRDNNNIWVVNTNGNELKKLTNMQALQHEPAWAPDGEWIYFSSGNGKEFHDIFRVSSKTKQVEKITLGKRYNFEASLSAKGILVYSSNRNGNYEIWMEKKGQKPEKITNHLAIDNWPTWSPDEKEIAFESTRTGTPNIWKINLEQGTPIQLTNHNIGARLPVWRNKGGAK